MGKFTRGRRALRAVVALATAAGVALPSFDAVLAASAVTTTDVNLRTGPGMRHAAVAVLPAGTAVEIVACADATVWCEVFSDGRTGFVSGNFLREIALPFDPPPGEEIALPGGGIELWEDIGFSEAELDDLVAPFALFPDAVIAEILIASTFPVDIAMAAQWIARNEDLTADERETAVAAEEWDESVAVLTVAFPAIVSELGADMAFTRDLGDAVLAQSDDVLEAIQRQRRRARGVGNLETNEVQVVTVENTFITIEPAQPDVVFIPRYDPQVVFTAPAPVVVQQAGVDPGAVALTGAIAFGTGFVVSQAFRRWDWWGPRRVNWNNNTVINVHPGWRPPPGPGWRPDPGRPGAGRPPGGRPGGGDVWRPDDRLREAARDRIRQRRPEHERPGLVRPPADRVRPDRPGIGGPDGVRPERPGIVRPDGTRPDRPGIAGPDGTRPGRPDLGRLRPDGTAPDRAPGGRPRPEGIGGTRPGTGIARPDGVRPGAPGGATRPDRAALEQRLQARSDRPGAASRPLPAQRPAGAPGQPEDRRAPDARPGGPRPGAGETALRRPDAPRPDARAAAERARQSGASPPRRPADSRPSTRPAAQPSRPRQAAPQRPPARAAPPRPAQRPSPPRRTAVDRGPRGGRDAAASRARGAASRPARNRN